MIKVAFRVDASIYIGIGHIMRCLTLAKELQKNNADILFITRDLNGSIIDTIKASGFKLYVLPKPKSILSANDQLDHRKWLQVSQNQDAEECSSTLEEFSPDWIIIDHYAIDHVWEKQLRKYTKKIFVIDDLSDRQHDCDILLDQTYKIPNSNYTSLVPHHCQILTGTKYALLRPEFALKRNEAIKKREKKFSIKNILISFGGVDKDNISLLSLKACELLASKYNFEIDVIIGSKNPNIEELKKYSAYSNHKILIHINSNKVANLMLNADLAIGAGGTTSWERCTLALPSLIISLAENQNQTIKNLKNENAVVYIGTSKDITKEKISSALEKIIKNPSLYQVMQQKASQICDGKGVKRISRKIHFKL